MKRVVLPKSKIIADREWTARILLEELVLAQPVWRSSLEMARTARVLFEALETSDGHLDLQDADHERLQQGIRMDGIQLQQVALNRYFLGLVEAVYDARKPPDPSEKA